MKLNEVSISRPSTKLKAMLIAEAYERCDQSWKDEVDVCVESDVSDLYDEIRNGEFGDALCNALDSATYDLRCDGEHTGLTPYDYCRHYEIDSVAVQTLDGSWVEFPYYHGGGKHSEPESIDWIPEARNVYVVEERMVVQRVFSLKSPI